jgi:hypothetical protein
MSADPPGWRPDPTGQHQYRYWDGEQWTDRVTDDAVASTTRDPAYNDGGTLVAVPPTPPPGPTQGNVSAGLRPDAPHAPDRAPGGHGPPGGRVVTKAPSTRTFVALGAAAAALIAAVVVFAVGHGGGATRGEERADDISDAALQARAETATSGANEKLRDVMRSAADQLQEAGTFVFDAEIVVPLPPGAFATVDRIELEGMVSLPASMRQRGRSTHYVRLGAEERVVVGDDAWRRGSAFPDSLDELPWIAEKQLLGIVPLPDGARQSAFDGVPDAFAATLIPQWLADATDHRDGGTDDGHRVITAQIAEGRVPRPGAATRPELTDATVELTVDHSDLPLSVRLSARIEGDMVAATYDLTAIGDSVTIEEPGPNELDSLPTVQEHDIAAVADQGVVPVGLTSPPGGWLLVDARVSDLPQDEVQSCTTASVDVTYRGPSKTWLHVSTRRQVAECEFLQPAGTPFTAGNHAGTVTGLGIDEGTIDIGLGPVHVADATLLDFDIDGMAVSVLAADVPDQDLAHVLASLNPIDPSKQAIRIDPPADPASGPASLKRSVLKPGRQPS